MRLLLHCMALLPRLLAGRLTLDQAPGLAAQAGLDGVEWLERLMPAYTVRDWQALAKAQEAAGSRAAALSLDLLVDGPPRLRAETVDRAKGVLALCPVLGVSAVRVGLAGRGLCITRLLLAVDRLAGGRRRQERPLGAAARLVWRWTAGAGRRAGGGPPAEGLLQRAAWSLEPLARQAADLGLALGVENHPGPCHRPQDLAELLDLARADRRDEHELSHQGWSQRAAAAQGRSLGACLDTGNLPPGQDPEEAAALLAPRAVHVHFKPGGPDGPGEGGATGRRAQAALVAGLKAAGYDGLVSLEPAGGGDPLEQARAAAGLFRELWEAAPGP
jgi:sugar phosphate isomerase/epimerase